MDKNIKTILGLLPFVGTPLVEFLTKTDTPEGKMSRDKLVFHLVKISIYGVLLYLIYTGKINWEDAENVKAFIE